MIVDGEPVARWVSERLGFALCPPYYAVGEEVDGEIAAAILLSNFEQHDVQITAAGGRWSRRLLRALHEYVFGQLGVLRATFLTEQPKVVGYAKRLGGEVEGLMRNHYGKGRHATVIGLLREDAIFYKVPESKRD